MWPDENGGWSVDQWVDPTGTTPQNGAGVQTNDVITSSAAQTTGEDRWSGWFQSLVGGVVTYAVQKDARQSGMVQATSANGQPIYTAAGTPAYVARPAGISGGELLVGLAVVAGVLLLKKG